MPPTTRFRILEFLRKQQTATVHELGLALCMTGANVRHHLAVLESNGLIEPISERREGRGRPVQVYGLSRRVLGDGLEDLSRAMLDVFVKRSNRETNDTDLRSLALQLAGDNRSGPGPALTRRLTRTADRLTELHYQARWEAGVDGPHVILGQCPYSAIIAAYPELCRMDAFLLEQSIGLPVEQTAKLKPGSKGYPYCTFRITVKK